MLRHWEVFQRVNSQFEYYETAGFGMGTIIEQKVAASSMAEGEAICGKITEAIRKLEDAMSYFIPASTVSRLNASRGESHVKIDSDTWNVLKSADTFYTLSDGAFDITAAPLTALWRESINTQTLPSEHTINGLLPFVSGAGIEWNEQEQTASLTQGQSIDLGGIAKGYAADIAIREYKKSGVPSAFINLGGNVHTLGGKINGEPWMIGLQDPRSKRGDIIAAIALSDLSTVTSGDYEKYFMVGGKRYHHIIDPKTGFPADSDLMSATVLSPSSMEADALSTAVFVSGLERGMEIIGKLPHAEAVLITKQKEVFITKGLEDSFFIQNPGQDYTFYYVR